MQGNVGLIDRYFNGSNRQVIRQQRKDMGFSTINTGFGYPCIGAVVLVKDDGFFGLS